MGNKINKIFFIFLLVAIVFTSQQFVSATWGEGLNIGILKEIISNPGNQKINNMFTTISTTIVIVFQALCVAGLAINGFKYMSAGAEGKSKIKQNLIWILFGLLLVTSGNVIINLIVRAGNQAL